MKIAITGSGGFLGKHLAKVFRQTGHEVITISRRGEHNWDDQDGLESAVDDTDVVINLAGKSVDCRYNARNRKRILESRVQTTARLGQAIKSCEHPPKLWINASTATIYRHAQDRPMTESDGEIGDGFSVMVAKAWENTFFSIETHATRKVALRMAIVLGAGGAFEKLRSIVRMGLGGRHGKGDQKFSWLHIDDLVGIIMHVIDDSSIKGVVNCSAPQPVENRHLMRTLTATLKPPIALPVPEWLLNIGAVFLRTETELVIKSRWVLPEKLQATGFRFQYPNIERAIKSLCITEN